MDRWHVGFVDLSGKQGLLGQSKAAPPRPSSTGWPTATKPRDVVQYVAIDMCTIFKSAIRRVLPQATLVVDHFHLVQLANQTLTEGRRRITVTHRGRKGLQDHRPRRLRLPQPRQPAPTHPLRDHPSSPWTPRYPLISLSPHDAIVLASGTELSVPQVCAWL